MVESFEFVDDRKRVVSFDGTALTINEMRCDLDMVERLHRSITRSIAQGSWNRLTCAMGIYHPDLGAAEMSLHGDASDPEWGPWRPQWDQLDSLIWDRVQVRLLARTLDAITAGTAVEIGSARSKGRGTLIVTAAGLKERRPMAKEIPWTSIVDIDVPAGAYQLHVRSDTGKVKKKLISLSPAVWDAWQLPLLHRTLSGG